MQQAMHTFFSDNLFFLHAIVLTICFFDSVFNTGVEEPTTIEQSDGQGIVIKPKDVRKR
jgi:hypothetical protein